MDQRIYHGDISPEDIARSLVAHFHRGNLIVQQIGEGDRLAVQIATSSRPASGGQTALSVNIQKVPDGVICQMGTQAWMGVAASLGMTALFAWHNPFNILHRLDDIAQDVENLQLVEEVWSVIGNAARSAGAGHQLSERLRRMVCSYCLTANPVGESRCIACGAPLGEEQPDTCRSCGYVLAHGERTCPNCGKPVR